MLITAHGISDRRRRRLERAGTHLIDTTCPLVARVHQAAQVASGRRLSCALDRPRRARGSPGHRRGLEQRRRHRVRVRGQAVRSPETGHRLPDDGDRASGGRDPGGDHPCGTRKPRSGSSTPSACRPRSTSARCERLLEQVDAVVVVGGRNSNNTRELVELCRRARPTRAARAIGRGSRPRLVPGFRRRRSDGRHLNARPDHRSRSTEP